MSETARNVELRIHIRDAAAKRDANAYLRASNFLNQLKQVYRAQNITFQQFSTLRGQAINGDIDGARKGLEGILNRG